MSNIYSLFDCVCFSENQAKFCQNRVANSEKYLGSLCEVMGKITRKTARIRDKGMLVISGLFEQIIIRTFNEMMINKFFGFQVIF